MARASAASVPTRGADPQVGHLRRLRALGVDDDHARAALLGGLQCCPLDRIGDRRVAADDQGATGVVDVLAAGDVEAHGARADGAAATAQVLVDHPVGRADRAHRQGEDHAAGEVGAARWRRRWPPARILPHLRQSLGHLAQRLIPGNARPLALAACAGAAHGIEQAVGAIGDAGRPADTFDAEGALGMGVVPVGRRNR